MPCFQRNWFRADLREMARSCSKLQQVDRLCKYAESSTIKVFCWGWLRVTLCSKKKILLTSLFTGLVGGDRFLLGHYKRGILKALVFLTLFIAIITVVGIITGRVAEVTSQMQGPISVTWEDNVAIAGEDIINTLYSFLAAAGCYILFVIADAVLCCRRCMNDNYMKLMAVKAAEA